MALGETVRAGHGRGNSISRGQGNLNHRRPSLAQDMRTNSGSSENSDRAFVGFSGPCNDEKPLASGNGVSFSIALAEPVLFLQGFEHADVGETERTTTMLRGSFHLRVTKSAKIKAINLNFRGRAETEWPEGQCLKFRRFPQIERNLTVAYRYPAQEDRVQG